MATRTKSTHAAAAQAIRQDLKRAFPGVKFRVRSSSFSMGNSVDVGWTDGPTRSEVDRIIGRYQYGHFDGMQDLYEYSNRRDDIPQAKYVSGSRSMSDQVRAELLSYVAERFFAPAERGGVTENTRMPNGNWWVQEQVWREFAERSYCEPAQWMPEEKTAEEPEQPEPVEDVEPRPSRPAPLQAGHVLWTGATMTAEQADEYNRASSVVFDAWNRGEDPGQSLQDAYDILYKAAYVIVAPGSEVRQ